MAVITQLYYQVI